MTAPSQTPEAAGLGHYAYARRWYIDGEIPKKERNENGRLAWPKRFTFNEVSTSKVFRDDEPLVTAASAEARISELETCLQDLTASLSAKLAHSESVAEAWKDRATAAEARVAALETRIVELKRDRAELARTADEWTTEAHERGNKLIAAEDRATAAEARADRLAKIIKRVGALTVEGKDHTQFANAFPRFAKLVAEARAAIQQEG